jgi:hypothetical protein
VALHVSVVYHKYLYERGLDAYCLYASAPAAPLALTSVQGGELMKIVRYAVTPQAIVRRRRVVLGRGGGNDQPCVVVPKVRICFRKVPFFKTINRQATTLA